MIKGLVFDVDGTLVDSNRYHINCWHRAFLEVGLEVDKYLIRSLIGKGARQIVDEVLGKGESQEKKEKVIQSHTRCFESVINQVEAFPGLRELLEEASRRELLVALATSTRADFVEHYLQKFGIANFVKACTTVEEVKYHKPHPDVFLKAVEKISLSKDEVVVVGDSVWDIQAAHRANMKVVALEAGGIKKELLLAEKPDWLFKDLIELKNKLDKILS